MNNNFFNDDNNYTNEEYKPKLNRVLNVKQYDRMVIDLVNSIESNQIILDPDYQRNYIWDNKKASLLVESILLNIPIPVIYAAENENNKWIIVDGLQRLTALKKFFNDEFKLVGLETLSELNGKKYSKLEESLKNTLSRGDLKIILLLNNSDPDIQYDIFMRLNSGAVFLNEQELRNCLYKGNFNDLLKNELINNEKFKAILNITENHKRMIDVETVLRYFAMSDSYDKVNKKMNDYDGRIKNLLNKFMRKYQNCSEELLNTFRDKFNLTIDKCYAVFGKDAFRKKNKNESFETAINRPLMDAVMISFESYTIETLVKNKDKILDATNKLLAENEQFLEYISKATGNTYNTEQRINIYREIIDNLVK